jgi:hypothetical protein
MTVSAAKYCPLLVFSIIGGKHLYAGARPGARSFYGKEEPREAGSPVRRGKASRSISPPRGTSKSPVRASGVSEGGQPPASPRNSRVSIRDRAAKSDRVVCTVSIGSQRIDTLAAGLSSRGSFQQQGQACFFALNKRQLDALAFTSPLHQHNVHIDCYMLAHGSNTKSLIGHAELDLRNLLRPPPGAKNEDDRVAYLMDKSLTHDISDVVYPDRAGCIKRACIFYRTHVEEATGRTVQPGNLSSLTWAPLPLDEMLYHVIGASQVDRAEKRWRQHEKDTLETSVANDSMQAGVSSEDSSVAPRKPHAPPAPGLSLAEGGNHGTEHHEQAAHNRPARVLLEHEEVMGWRERLERRMDSLGVSIGIVLLVVLDVAIAAVFDLGAASEVETSSENDAFFTMREVHTYALKLLRL